LSAFGRDQASESGSEVVADLLPPAGGLELVDVEVHRDRRACVSQLSLHANWVETALCEVGSVRMPQVVGR